jgi:hypothetical protein
VDSGANLENFPDEGARFPEVFGKTFDPKK